eukprot:1715-Heterococcus_DN1.PRE.5
MKAQSAELYLSSQLEVTAAAPAADVPLPHAHCMLLAATLLHQQVLLAYTAVQPLTRTGSSSTSSTSFTGALWPASVELCIKCCLYIL